MRKRLAATSSPRFVLGYEIYLRMSDAVKTPGFDCANFCCMGAALDAGKLFGLNAENLSECLSMAVVPNNALNQARTGHLSRCGRRSHGAIGTGRRVRGAARASGHARPAHAVRR